MGSIIQSDSDSHTITISDQCFNLALQETRRRYLSGQQLLLVREVIEEAVADHYDPNLSDILSDLTIWSTGPKGSASYASRGWRKLTGNDPATALNMDWIDFIPSDDLDLMIETIRVSVSQRSPVACEHRLRCADGTYIWMRGCGTPRFRNGKYIGHIGASFQIPKPDSVITKAKVILIA
jgi:PAS domain S-box-containing protein